MTKKAFKDYETTTGVFFSIDDYHFAWFQRNFSVVTKEKFKEYGTTTVFLFSLIMMITLPGFGLSGPLCSSTVLCKSKSFLLLLEIILSNN